MPGLGTNVTAERRTPRATPLAPAARRAAIVEATLPLLRRHGLSITTRQIAEAAGVAEGTIFSVFPDKEALLHAVVEAAFDPEPVRAQLATISLDDPLETRLAAAVTVIQHHLAGIWELLSAPGLGELASGRPRKGPPWKGGRVVEFSALARLLEPDRASLRRPPEATAQLLVGLILAGSHPAVISDSLPADEIVGVLLDGVRASGPSGPSSGGL
jgi:AcrR family transcriptional regulator